MNFRPLSKVFMIADSGVLPLNSLRYWVSFIVNWGSISKDFPQDFSILTATFTSLLVFAVAISIIFMPRLVFTLIQRLHHRLPEACIINQITQYVGKNPKKRDLSDGSKTGDDDFKKPREGSSEVTLMKLIFLRKVLNQLTAGEFYVTNCLKNLEEKNKRSLHASEQQ